LVSLKPAHYSDGMTRVGKTDGVKADNDDISTYRLDVVYTVISRFFRRFILYNRFVTLRKYNF
jgi:hypothetical protein